MVILGISCVVDGSSYFTTGNTDVIICAIALICAAKKIGCVFLDQMHRSAGNFNMTACTIRFSTANTCRISSSIQRQITACNGDIVSSSSEASSNCCRSASCYCCKTSITSDRQWRSIVINCCAAFRAS